MTSKTPKDKRRCFNCRQPLGGPTIKCTVCKKELQSITQHDFKLCKCGRVGIDGGGAYVRLIGDLDYIEFYNKLEDKWIPAKKTVYNPDSNDENSWGG